MYKTLLSVVYCCLISCTLLAREVCPLIPQPVSATKLTGHFLLSRNSPIRVSDPSLRSIAHLLQQELLRFKGIPLTVQEEPTTAAIVLKLDSALTDAEAYTLLVSAQGITIQSGTAAGLRHGIASLLQLVQAGDVSGETIRIPAWQITDQPRYAWRGFMLDESRHFFGKEKVKSILDWMMFYKLNKFHWHLTDEPAWRIEIKKYPLLTLIGGIGSFTDGTLPAEYYTQQDINEVVAYAAQRGIDIIPEIDMPGHATAANRAYPQYSGGGTPDHPHFTFSPGKEETYTFLTDILRETTTLFPSGLLHLGGDEVSFGSEAWKTDPEIQALQSTHSLATAKDVEHYFMKRMADSVYSLNAMLLAWDEMAEADLPQDRTIIFWWRHDKPEQLKSALEKGYSTVICPRLPLYFDFVQDSAHTYGRKWGNLYNPLNHIYEFDVDVTVPAVAGDEKILGLQANMWTETVTNINRLDFLLFPRIAALAEAAWTTPENRDYLKFSQKLETHLQLYRRSGIYYYNPFQPNNNPEPVVYKIKRDLTVERN